MVGGNVGGATGGACATTVTGDAVAGGVTRVGAGNVAGEAVVAVVAVLRSVDDVACRSGARVVRVMCALCLLGVVAPCTLFRKSLPPPKTANIAVARPITTTTTNTTTRLVSPGCSRSSFLNVRSGAQDQQNADSPSRYPSL